MTMMIRGLQIQGEGPPVGQYSGQDKEVKGNKRTNRVHSGKNVSNSVNVNTFTVLSKLNCFYTNADQLFNKMAELIVRTRDSKPNIIGIPEVKPKLNRYKPELAECSLTEVGRYKMNEKILIGKKAEASSYI